MARGTREDRVKRPETAEELLLWLEHFAVRITFQHLNLRAWRKTACS
jgi:hypothetical protein